MSKYGKLRTGEKSGGFSSWLLTETLEMHDATMEHPFMKTIYDGSFSVAAYTQYLANQHAMFSQLERLTDSVVADTSHADVDTIKALFDPVLNRTEKIAQDLVFLAGDKWAEEAATSAATDKYMAMLGEDSGDVLLVATHHMMQYLAVLSGGQYLGQQVSKKFKDTDSKYEAGEGVNMYAFKGLKASQHPKYVQAYMDRFDTLDTEAKRAAILDCSKKIYSAMLSMMDECYEMAPRDPNAPVAKPDKPKASGENLKVTLAELSEYDGIKNKRLIISIGRVLLDVSSAGNMYGPGGGYHLFAGHDCTRSLATMNLGKDCLDDPDYEPENEKHRKVKDDWIAKLSAKYPVCGELIGPGAYQGDGATAKAKKAAASGETCPITGQAAKDGESCPMSMTTTAGECPWPFVFFHDPMGGLHPKHWWKNLIALGAISAIVLPFVS